MKKLFSIIALCLVGTATNAQAPYAQFQGGMIGCIEPQGWIEEFLHRQQTGLTGHPEAMSYPYDSCLWAGEIGRNTEATGGATSRQPITPTVCSAWVTCSVIGR